MKFLLLRAYLWGIETWLFLKIFQIHNTGCEPTYEELKPDVKGKTGFIKEVSCEPTYEELKQKKEVKKNEKKICCEPTYEELKLK